MWQHTDNSAHIDLSHTHLRWDPAKRTFIRSKQDCWNRRGIFPCSRFSVSTRPEQAQAFAIYSCSFGLSALCWIGFVIHFDPTRQSSGLLLPRSAQAQLSLCLFSWSDSRVASFQRFIYRSRWLVVLGLALFLHLLFYCKVSVPVLEIVTTPIGNCYFFSNFDSKICAFIVYYWNWILFMAEVE